MTYVRLILSTLAFLFLSYALYIAYDAWSIFSGPFLSGAELTTRSKIFSIILVAFWALSAFLVIKCLSRLISERRLKARTKRYHQGK